ncbi:MAG: ABC transporter substrate-binding protein [Thaumarchaeota archaeon]|nr:ABC transporter substrate-binding protein [Nitrososphaerota archaeon]
MEITLGHTPDADDAFMFYGMLSGKVKSPDFTVNSIVEDIETLNRRALKHELDVTAVSVHACAYIPDYTILRSGGSFGKGYGPIVIAKNKMTVEELKKTKIAVPGKLTTAFLLLQLMIGKFDYVEMKFSDIPAAVERGDVGAGLVIHETQITYDQNKLAKILDTGVWWRDSTGGLPVPLGINVISNHLGNETIKKFDEFFRESIVYGMNRLNEALDYAMQYSRGQPRTLIERFVRMYVNDHTIEMGLLGESAIKDLFKFAAEKGIIPEFVPRIAQLL